MVLEALWPGCTEVGARNVALRAGPGRAFTPAVRVFRVAGRAFTVAGVSGSARSTPRAAVIRSRGACRWKGDGRPGAGRAARDGGSGAEPCAFGDPARRASRPPRNDRRR